MISAVYFGQQYHIMYSKTNNVTINIMLLLSNKPKMPSSKFSYTTRLSTDSLLACYFVSLRTIRLTSVH